MTDAWWEQLEELELPTETVPLPLAGGGTSEVVLRALPPAAWDALCEAYPARGENAEPGEIDLVAMRPKLLAAAVVAADGSPPKDPVWWEQLASRGGPTAGELDLLVNAAYRLNQARAVADLGKG